ncbi:MGH1-like glycoside hydrolase domain-containing protein [Georgenia thermotolerans]|uniref:Mannosylglycerate hydrolase MGH1-like glycoside hydrolase domain-containing protein n=1 Tax=Georgenia thermotolerans TaxID=527326 RepID=A0A7J5UT74_9MICO|nr:hypothetical protein [Georgenia thermotolerans]KAE8765501.1 hypothetical protein GB883_03680 [Georgenia thermotolerans]
MAGTSPLPALSHGEVRNVSEAAGSPSPEDPLAAVAGADDSAAPPAPAEVRGAAAALLEQAGAGHHTARARGAHPDQWGWDSCLVAIGLRHVAPDRAQTELEALLTGQWEDGRLPQLIFELGHEAEVAPGDAFWRSRGVPGSAALPTSGLVSPPVHAAAALLVHLADPGRSRERGFLPRLYPRLLAWHRYLATRRDHRGAGLASIVHPWESATVGSPLWDEAMADVPAAGPDLSAQDAVRIGAPEPGAPTELARELWLAGRYRDAGYDDEAAAAHPFAMEDPAFNALWAVSELALAEMAVELGRDPAPHRARATRITTALEGLYVPELGVYGAHDVVRERLVRRPTVTGLVPLLLPELGHADDLVATLRGPGFLGGGALVVPSYDLRAPDVDLTRSGRGPGWFTTNWFVVTGLHEHLEGPLADGVAEQLLALAVRHDFPEHVDPMTGDPHPVRGVSATAAVVLDLAAAPHRR